MGSVTSSYGVDFKAPARPTTTAPGGRVLRVARLLALAHSIDARIRSGELRDLAHAAKVLGVTRARMTQISNLVLLAPAIQEAILEWPSVTEGRDPVTERTLRGVVEADWQKQIAIFHNSARPPRGRSDGA